MEERSTKLIGSHVFVVPTDDRSELRTILAAQPCTPTCTRTYSSLSSGQLMMKYSSFPVNGRKGQVSPDRAEARKREVGARVTGMRQEQGVHLEHQDTPWRAGDSGEWCISLDSEGLDART